MSSTKLYGSVTQKLEQLSMRKLPCLLFVLKRSYICYYIICMTVPLIRYYQNIAYLYVGLCQAPMILFSPS